MLATIDGDVIVYRVGFASESIKHKVFIPGTEEEFGPVAVHNTKKQAEAWLESNPIEGAYIEKELTPDPLNNCLHSVKVVIQDIIENTGATHYKLFLTGGNQFRPKIATLKPYKGNRDPLHKPHYYNEIKEYLRRYWDAVDVDYYEADDMLAMEQQKAHTTFDAGHEYEHFDPDYCPSIICTIDKDLDQVPGWHYNFVKKEKYFVTPEYATRWLYQQIISGDPTDNIPGIPGMGTKKAEKALDNCKTELEMYKVIQGLYEKAYKEQAQEALLETARLVYMIRKEGEEWTPPV